MPIWLSGSKTLRRWVNTPINMAGITMYNLLGHTWGIWVTIHLQSIRWFQVHRWIFINLPVPICWCLFTTKFWSRFWGDFAETVWGSFGVVCVVWAQSNPWLCHENHPFPREFGGVTHVSFNVSRKLNLDVWVSQVVVNHDFKKWVAFILRLGGCGHASQRVWCRWNEFASDFQATFWCK